MPPRFHYKGLSAEDRTFAKTPTESAELARGTLYEAWFDTLKMSPWYNEIAVTGVYPSDAAEATWKHFGDLRKATFAAWWRRRGYQIFAEEVPYTEVQTTDLAFNVVNGDEQSNKPPILRLDIPLNLSPAALQEQFRKILRAHENYQGEFDRWHFSTAPVHQERESKFHYSTIKQLLSFYKEYEVASSEEGLKLHEFALRKKLIPGRSKAKAKDIRHAIESNSELLQNEKTMLANAVSDKLKQAKFLMANATEGHFPDDRPHPWAQTRQRTSKG